VLEGTNALPDLRVLAGIAEEMGTTLGFRTVSQVTQEMREVGPWDGERVAAPTVAGIEPAPLALGAAVLSSWRPMLDDGRLQEGEPYLAATARAVVALVPASLLDSLGLPEGADIALRTAVGAVAFPARVADLPDGVVWAPANSGGLPLSRLIGAGAGDVVTVEAAPAQPAVAQGESA